MEGEKQYKKGLWTEEEDKVLKEYIKVHGRGQWNRIPKATGLRRCGKSCRLRWLNYLSPNVKRGGFSQEEEDLIIRLHNLLGNRWSLIAGRVPGRTDNQVKNHWNTHLSKKLGIIKKQSARKGVASSKIPHVIDDNDDDEVGQQGGGLVSIDSSVNVTNNSNLSQNINAADSSSVEKTMEAMEDKTRPLDVVSSNGEENDEQEPWMMMMMNNKVHNLGDSVFLSNDDLMLINSPVFDDFLDAYSLD